MEVVFLQNHQRYQKGDVRTFTGPIADVLIRMNVVEPFDAAKHNKEKSVKTEPKNDLPAGHFAGGFELAKVKKNESTLKVSSTTRASKKDDQKNGKKNVEQNGKDGMMSSGKGNAAKR